MSEIIARIFARSDKSALSVDEMCDWIESEFGHRYPAWIRCGQWRTSLASTLANNKMFQSSSSAGAGTSASHSDGASAMSLSSPLSEHTPRDRLWSMARRHRRKSLSAASSAKPSAPLAPGKRSRTAGVVGGGAHRPSSSSLSAPEGGMDFDAPFFPSLSPSSLFAPAPSPPLSVSLHMGGLGRPRAGSGRTSPRDAVSAGFYAGGVDSLSPRLALELDPSMGLPTPTPAPMSLPRSPTSFALGPDALTHTNTSAPMSVSVSLHTLADQELIRVRQDRFRRVAAHWTSARVERLLSELRLSAHWPLFVRHEMWGERFAQLTDEVLFSQFLVTDPKQRAELLHEIARPPEALGSGDSALSPPPGLLFLTAASSPDRMPLSPPTSAEAEAEAEAEGLEGAAAAGAAASTSTGDDLHSPARRTDEGSCWGAPTRDSPLAHAEEKEEEEKVRAKREEPEARQPSIGIGKKQRESRGKGKEKGKNRGEDEDTGRRRHRELTTSGGASASLDNNGKQKPKKLKKGKVSRPGPAGGQQGAGDDEPPHGHLHGRQREHSRSVSPSLSPARSKSLSLSAQPQKKRHSVSVASLRGSASASASASTSASASASASAPPTAADVALEAGLSGAPAELVELVRRAAREVYLANDKTAPCRLAQECWSRFRAFLPAAAQQLLAHVRRAQRPSPAAPELSPNTAESIILRGITTYLHRQRELWKSPKPQQIGRAHV